MLKNATAFSGFSVPDLGKAKQFYGETLGLDVEESPEGLKLRLKGGNEIFIYHSPTNKPADYTMLNFVVDNIEQTVDELVKKGVRMEQYDTPPYIKTDEKGIARGDGTGPRAMAWCKDPAGNILGLLQEK